MREEGVTSGPAGLDLAFLHRVYRTSAVVWLLGAALLWEGAGPGARWAAVLGWSAGALLGLGVLASVEWSVRRFLRPEAESLRPLLAVSLAKLLLVAVALFLALLAALRGWLSLPWMLAGFSLPPAVILLKLAGRKLLEWSARARP